MTEPKPRSPSRFRKPSAELIAQFNQAITPLPGVTPRKMFGCPCAFINGNMFAGVFEDSLFVRLSVADRIALAQYGARPFEPLPGRPMREYVVVPPGTLKSKRRLNEWLEKSFAFAAALPAKTRKKKSA